MESDVRNDRYLRNLNLFIGQLILLGKFESDWYDSQLVGWIGKWFESRPSVNDPNRIELHSAMKNADEHKKIT